MKSKRSYHDVRLTTRQRAIIPLVAEGLGNLAIAKRLRITEDAVKNRLRLIFLKPGLDNRILLALWHWKQVEVEVEDKCR